MAAESPMGRNVCPDRELYEAIVEAEAAVKHAHDLCYRDGGHGSGYWLRTRLGKCQSILMHYVVKHAGRHQRAASESELLPRKWRDV